MFNRKKPVTIAQPSSDFGQKMFRVKSDLRAGALTVYGSPTCGWCKKQVAYLNSEQIPFDFVDCTTQVCPDFVTGYPTLDRDGEITVGFTAL